MKKITFLVLALVFYKGAVAQLNKQLCRVDEEIIFAFRVQNGKWVSVCKEKNGNYIVYRFGTKDKTEMQYPAKPDSNSWQQFTFQGYMRGGGKQNAAMRFGYLNFSNEGVQYEISDTWNSDDDKESCGITITMKTKTTGMNGILKSRKGSLVELIYEDKIKKESEH